VAPTGEDAAALRSLLDWLDPDMGYDDWLRVGMALHHETEGSPDGLALWDEWSSRGVTYPASEGVAAKWDSFSGAAGRAPVTLAWLRGLAERVSNGAAIDSADFPVLDINGREVNGYECRHVDGAAVVAGRGGLGHAGRGSGAGGPADRARAMAGVAGLAGQARGVGVAVGGLADHGGRAAGGGVAAAADEVPRVAASQRPAERAERRGIPEAKHLCTDQANANRLVKAYGSRVLVAGGRWYVWDGRVWRGDDADVYRYACRLSAIVKDEAKAVLAKAQAAVESDGGVGGRMRRAEGVAEALEKWSVKCEGRGAIEAAVGLARKMLTVDAGLLDADPWLLNVANGVVDLRDGSLRAHRAEDLMTKLVPVDYVPDARCEAWERALLEICGESGESAESERSGGSSGGAGAGGAGSAGSSGGAGGSRAPVASFLQRWFGYCLTGHVREQVFVVHWGDGSNGKSTVMGLMAKTLGDYAGVAAPGLIASSDKSERHPTEIAALMGRRMVTAHETREGVQLREDFIKQATGDDRLSARFMREDFFDFAPTHKINLLTNHKPVVKGQDAGIWRRVMLVPYGVTFGTAEQVAQGRASRVKDMELAEALSTEEALRGVLAWRVRGAVVWAEEGLRPPGAVLDASARYQTEHDRVGLFVAECCEVVPGAREPLTLGMGGLYPSYKSWCAESGFHGLARGRFVDELRRVVPGLQIAETYGKGESGARRKILQVAGLRLLPE
jgi:putative DNA primase/helicase